MKFLMLSMALYAGVFGSSISPVSGPEWIVIEEEGEETVIINDGNYGCIQHIEIDGNTFDSTFYGDCGPGGPQQ